MVNYMYLAGIDPAYCVNNAKNRVANKMLSSNRVLMSDTLSYWSGFEPSSGWYYNHGKTTPALPWIGVGGDDGGIPDEMAGVNQLFGDGSVHWKNAGEFPAETMDPSLNFGPYDGPWVGHYPGAASGYFF